MKKLFLLIGLLTLCNRAEALELYFSQSTGNNANPCTQALPCRDFIGTSYDNAGAISAGSTIYFKRGDVWPYDQATVWSRSAGTAAAHITFRDYGDANLSRPQFLGANNTFTSGWTVHSGNVWKRTMSNANTIRTVGVDKSYALVQWWWNATNTGGDCTVSSSCPDMQKGTFKQSYGSPNTLYIRMPNNENPNNHTIYVSNWRMSITERGLVGTYPNSTAYPYNDFLNLDIIYSPERNFVLSSPNCTIQGSRTMGAAMDGVHIQKDADEDGAGAKIIQTEISWNVAYGSGTSSGQGFTTYTRAHVINCDIHDNYMAGADFLDFSAATDAQQSSIIQSRVYNNGRCYDQYILANYSNVCFDPNIYVDGAAHVVVKDNQVYSTDPVGGDASLNGGIKFGSEHPISKRTQYIYVINNLVYNNKGGNVGSDNANTCSWDCGECLNNCTTQPNNITNIYIINNTLVQFNSSYPNLIYDNADSTVIDGWHIYNNIFLFQSYNAIWTNTSAMQDIHYNLYFRRGTTPTTTKIYSGSGCTSTSGCSSWWNLSEWQALTPSNTKDTTGSFYANPYLVNDSSGTMDAHLKRIATGHSDNSPAIDSGLENPWTPPSWFVSSMVDPLNGEIKGTTRTDNVADDVNTAMDIGYHYPLPLNQGPGIITNANVEPATLVQGDQGTIVVSGTIEHAWAVNEWIWLYLPANLGNWTFNSGATSTVTCDAGCNGTLGNITVSGNTISAQRLTGTTTTAGTAIQLSFTNIKNPMTAGQLDKYQLSTLTTSGAPIDVTTTIPGDVITQYIPPSTPSKTVITGHYTIEPGGNFRIELD